MWGLYIVKMSFLRLRHFCQRVCWAFEPTESLVKAKGLRLEDFQHLVRTSAGPMVFVCFELKAGEN